MSLADKFSIIVLVLSEGAQIFKRSFLDKYIKLVFFFSAAAMFGNAVYYTFLQYDTWSQHPISVFLLPPYQGWSYFAYYVGLKFFSPIIVAISAAIILKAISHYLNKRFDGRFFEQEEGWLFGLGVLLTGYPGFIFYVPLMLLFSLMLSIFYTIVKKGRAPLFYLWLPVAIFAILLKSLIPQSVLSFFVI